MLDIGTINKAVTDIAQSDNLNLLFVAVTKRFPKVTNLRVRDTGIYCNEFVIRVPRDTPVKAYDWETFFLASNLRVESLFTKEQLMRGIKLEISEDNIIIDNKILHPNGTQND